VAAEFALVAVRKTRVEEMVKQGLRGATSVEDAFRHLDRSIAAAQLGITIASIALGWVCEPALVRLIGPVFDFLPAHWEWVTAHLIATILTFFLITFLHVVLGEQLPKTMALQTPDQSALWIARPLNTFARITRPLIQFMNWIGNVLLRAFGYRPAGAEAAIHSVDELRLLIEDTQEAGILAPDQATFVQNVFKMSDKTVQECMIPPEKIAALEINTPYEKMMEIVTDTRHTRMPVYEGTLDNIRGIVNTKDLFYLIRLGQLAILEDAMYRAIFLPPDEPIVNALRLFRRSRKHMALVRDDEDRIMGMITLEDVLEEIVGDIEDEHDVRANPSGK
jgi:CBS domain containing-hemolysin-like protein